jgi:hypothetical protein
VANFCGRGDEPSGSMIRGRFLENVGDCWLLRDSAQWS